MAKKKAKKNQTSPKVHKDLEGMNISINALGEIEANYDVAKLNEFLNRKTEDRKLQSHPEWSDENSEKEEEDEEKNQTSSSASDEDNS